MTIPILKHEVNAHHRQFYIDKVNGPLVKAISVFAKGASWLGMLLSLIEIVRDVRRYPDPTMANVLHPNSKLLLSVLEKYGSFEGNNRIAEVVKVLVKVIVVKLEHCPNYRDRISWWVEVVPKGWKPRSLNHPEHDWNEPKPYGGNK
jgi:hypothetical protein